MSMPLPSAHRADGKTPNKSHWQKAWKCCAPPMGSTRTPWAVPNPPLWTPAPHPLWPPIARCRGWGAGLHDDPPPPSPPLGCPPPSAFVLLLAAEVQRCHGSHCSHRPQGPGGPSASRPESQRQDQQDQPLTPRPRPLGLSLPWAPEVPLRLVRRGSEPRLRRRLAQLLQRVRHDRPGADHGHSAVATGAELKRRNRRMPSAKRQLLLMTPTVVSLLMGHALLVDCPRVRLFAFWGLSRLPPAVDAAISCAIARPVAGAPGRPQYHEPPNNDVCRLAVGGRVCCGLAAVRAHSIGFGREGPVDAKCGMCGGDGLFPHPCPCHLAPGAATGTTSKPAHVGRGVRVDSPFPNRLAFGGGGVNRGFPPTHPPLESTGESRPHAAPQLP